MKAILEGTYEFPSGTDSWTIEILKQACYVFQKMSGEEIVGLVSREDFQEYWTTACEMTAALWSLYGLCP